MYMEYDSTKLFQNKVTWENFFFTKLDHFNLQIIGTNFNCKILLVIADSLSFWYIVSIDIGDQIQFQYIYKLTHVNPNSPYDVYSQVLNSVGNCSK